MVNGTQVKTEEKTTDKLSVPANEEVLAILQKMEEKLERIGQNQSIRANGVKEAVLGSLAADAGKYATQKLLAPQLLPATKGDIEILKRELIQLKRLIIFPSGQKPTFKP